MILRALVDAIRPICSNVAFSFTDLGVEMQCMDPARIGLVVLALPKRTFTKYVANWETSDSNGEVLGINLDSFSKILHCATKEDQCVLSTDSRTADTLNISLKGNKRTLDYDLRLMDIPYDPIKIPKKDPDVLVAFPKADYQALVKDMGTLGENVTILAEEDSVTFIIESATGKGRLNIEYDDNAIECVVYEEDVKQLFAVKYLTLFSKPCSFCEKVLLKMQANQPIAIAFFLPEMTNCLINDNDDTNNYGKLVFYLAPKVHD